MTQVPYQMWVNHDFSSLWDILLILALFCIILESFPVRRFGQYCCLERQQRINRQIECFLRNYSALFGLFCRYGRRRNAEVNKLSGRDSDGFLFANVIDVTSNLSNHATVNLVLSRGVCREYQQWSKACQCCTVIRCLYHSSGRKGSNSEMSVPRECWPSVYELNYDFSSTCNRVCLDKMSAMESWHTSLGCPWIRFLLIKTVSIFLALTYSPLYLIWQINSRML